MWLSLSKFIRCFGMANSAIVLMDLLIAILEVLFMRIGGESVFLMNLQYVLNIGSFNMIHLVVAPML